jgi:hypothetical protein
MRFSKRGLHAIELTRGLVLVLGLWRDRSGVRQCIGNLRALKAFQDANLNTRGRWSAAEDYERVIQ